MCRSIDWIHEYRQLDFFHLQNLKFQRIGYETRGVPIANNIAGINMFHGVVSSSATYCVAIFLAQ